MFVGYKTIELMTYDNSQEEMTKEQRNSCNSKENTPEYVGLLGSIIDIIGNLSIVTIIVVGVITLLLSLIWSTIDYCEAQRLQICDDILVMCSCVLGFSITGFSVILSLNNDTLERLTNTPKIPNRWWKCFIKKKSTPYDILCASFSSTCFILLFTIIVVIFYKNMPTSLYIYNWYFTFIQALSIISVLFVFDLILHLYAVSTYLNRKHNRVRICNNKNE